MPGGEVDVRPGGWGWGWVIAGGRPLPGLQLEADLGRAAAGSEVGRLGGKFCEAERSERPGRLKGGEAIFGGQFSGETCSRGKVSYLRDTWV